MIRVMLTHLKELYDSILRRFEDNMRIAANGSGTGKTVVWAASLHEHVEPSVVNNLRRPHALSAPLHTIDAKPGKSNCYLVDATQ
jgi:hypothetical protein